MDDYFFCVIDRVRKASLDVLWLYSPEEAREFLDKPSLEFNSRELLLSIHRDTVPVRDPKPVTHSMGLSFSTNLSDVTCWNCAVQKESLIQPINVNFCHDPNEVEFPLGSRKASRKNRAKFGKSDWQDPTRPFVCYRLIDTGHKKTIYRFEHGGYTPEVTKILKRLLLKEKPRSLSPPGRPGPKKTKVRHLCMVEEGNPQTRQLLFLSCVLVISGRNRPIWRNSISSGQLGRKGEYGLWNFESQTKEIRSREGTFGLAALIKIKLLYNSLYIAESV